MAYALFKDGIREVKFILDYHNLRAAAATRISHAMTMSNEFGATE